MERTVERVFVPGTGKSGVDVLVVVGCAVGAGVVLLIMGLCVRRYRGRYKKKKRQAKGLEGEVELGASDAL